MQTAMPNDPDVADNVSTAPAGREQSAYLQGARRHAYIHVPQPYLRDAQEDVEESYEESSARITEALQNSGWVSGVVEMVVSHIVGKGLRLSAKPIGSMWGWDDKQTSDWAKSIEQRWGIYSNSPRACDAGGRYTIGQMTSIATKQWFATGEIAADLPFIHRPGTSWSSKIRLIPSHWMSQDTMPIEGLRQGVYLDRHGAPIGYKFDVKNTDGTDKTVKRKARDTFGRLKTLHVFEGAAGQVRGISPLACVVKIISQYEQLADATLTAAMIHAIFAATIESDYPNSDVLGALQTNEEQIGVGEQGNATLFDTFMQQKVGWHQGVDINLGNHGKIAHLLMGESLKLNGSEHPNSTFEPFANFLLREVARAAGAMAEDVTGDLRGATYSSVRMGISKMWPLNLSRRKHIAAPLPQAAYTNWLEEDIDAGNTPFPGGIDAFVHYRDAATNAEWMGPPKPQADDLKAAHAHREYKDMGVMSDEDICNDLGTDRSKVYEQQAHERMHRETLKLPHPLPKQGGDPSKALSGEAGEKQGDVDG